MKMIRRIIIYLLCLIIFAAPTMTGAEQYSFTNISTVEGLSQLSVLCIFQDSNGYMWFGTRDGLNKYDGLSFEHYFNRRQDSTSISDNHIKCIGEDANGYIWAGTRFGMNRLDPDSGKVMRFFLDRNNLHGESNTVRALYVNKERNLVYAGGFCGLYALDSSEGEFKPVNKIKTRVNDIAGSGDTLFVATATGLYAITGEKLSFWSPFEPESGKHCSVDVIYIDNDRTLWLSSYRNGIVHVDPVTWNVLERFDVVQGHFVIKNEVRAIARVSDKYMMLGTNAGLKLYDITSGKIESADSQFSNCSIESLLVDRSKGLWVGTYSDGIGYSHSYIGRFKHHVFPVIDDPVGTSGPMLMYKGILYIGTEGGGLMTYDPESGSYNHYPCVQKSDNPFRDNNVKSIYRIGNTIYVGLYSGWIYLFDTDSMKFSGKYHVPGDVPVYAILKDNDRILLGTYAHNGLKELLPEQGIVRDCPFMLEKGYKNTRVSALLRSRENLYIGTRTDGLFKYDGRILHHYVFETGDHITGKMISMIMEDSRGNLFVGTYDGGLSILKHGEQSFVTLTRKDGLNDDMICSVIEDMENCVWVVTHGGISKLSDDFQISNTYTHSSGLNIREFSISSALVTDDNVIYVGGDNGFLSFSPEDLVNNTDIPPVLIESVYVNNERYPFDMSSGLTLSNRQNSLTFRYIALSYIYPEQNSYSCMLAKARDTSWTFMGNARIIRYANLSPGKYVFKVKAANNDGFWNDTVTEIPIRIKPSVYMSWYAFVIYALLIVIVAFFIGHYILIRQNLEHEKIIKKNEKMFYQARIDLFTKFSHELRTPLSLIQGPIEEVVQTNDPTKMDMSSFKVVYNNLNRILLLLDQLLTFRKKETDSLKVNVSAGDFIGFAREIRLAFSELARIHKIDFRFEESKISSDVWYDRSMFERVLMNILSNAFKYTPDGGVIKMSVDSVPKEYVEKSGKVKLLVDKEIYPEYLRIRIEDTGPGIPEDCLEKIFDPFFQASDKNGGTGLGLTLSSEIVRMHHGLIWAENHIGGAVFIVLIPIGNTHFVDSEIIKDYENSENINRYYRKSQEVGIPFIRPSKDSTVLIVEDNKELRDFMTSRLSSYFNIKTAANGREALLLTRSVMPALVVSDIMMPIMDGLQLCREIKNDRRLSHIPVILLSARTLAIQMQEGLELGADDYITKPFSINSLALKISNILFSRENLKSLYARDLTFENMGIDIVSQDEKFLYKLNEVVSQNITDPDLDVGQFCTLLGMSRSSLYRKLQSSTGLSPSKYLQAVRLHLAAKMLKETSMTISEILDTVGYTNAAHFSTIFKKKYGVSPSSYRSQ